VSLNANSVDESTLYRAAMRLLESMPTFVYGTANVEARKWIATVMALADQVLSVAERAQLPAVRQRLGSMAAEDAWREFQDTLFRIIAILELRVPRSLSESFVPVGGSFDAFTALARVFSRAKRDVFVVDPYLDETVLTDFVETVASNVHIRLLADEQAVKASLRPAAARWMAQYGASRPLQIRLAPSRTLHDRAIFLDGIEAWTLTQSLKDFAARAPGEIMRNGSAANLKIEAYGAIWDRSKPL
jgi:hypothetical protein